jgi:hypothetical protein
MQEQKKYSMNYQPGNEWNKIPKENPFGVPEGYFNTFSARLNSRIEQRNAKARSPILLAPRLVPVWIASGIAAILIIGFFMIKKPIKPDIPMASFNESIEMTGYYFDESDLVIALEEENISFSASGISRKDIIDYLINENYSIHDNAEIF